MSDTNPAWERMAAAERELVRDLGGRIGYGRTMQLCEQMWRENLSRTGMAGGEHSVACCVVFLTPCPGCAPAHEQNAHCEWCCGAGRVTKRVAQAIEKEFGK